jgi:diacylglycerol kinase family enzyme
MKMALFEVNGICSSSFDHTNRFRRIFTATIHTNNQTLVCEARMIVIANSKKYGSGIVINPNGSMNDGKFELIILKNLDLIVLLKIITGNMPIYSEDVEIISTDQATITTSVPVNFQMDGEYYGYKSQLDISILSKNESCSSLQYGIVI